MKNWAAVTLIGILVIALAVSVTPGCMDAGKIKDLNSKIADQQAVIDKIEAPRHFNSLDELNTWLQQAAVYTKYAALRPIERAYILQVLALRDGYLLPAGFDVSGTTFYSFNTAYINGTIYNVSPSTNVVSNFNADGSALVVSPLSSQPLPPP